MSETTGVTVFRPSGLNPNRVDHPEADSINVKDGHLFVMRGGLSVGDTVAIYAPGAWTYTKVGGGE